MQRARLPHRPTLKLTDWTTPLLLILLALIPMIAGSFRLASFLGDTEITNANTRFFAAPVPVTLHILGAIFYSIAGAFQFSAGIRHRWPAWHRWTGRLLVPTGLAVALSGIWMTIFYEIVPADTPLLFALRLLFGTAMALFLVLGFTAIRNGNVRVHQAWMRRAYAIALGAGTQALIQIPTEVFAFKPTGDTLAAFMGAGWLINVAVAEYLIARPGRSKAPSAATAAKY